MANRRMFSLKIIDTDLFLDMPVSSQLLYFHLSMRADDDGFVSSPKKIIKMVNCSEDDFKVLRAKNFIIPFESGICVIRHWKIHNYIQSDRYNKTMYLAEKEALLDVNGTYEINELKHVDTECIQDGYISDTQVRLGKVRLGKDRLEIDAKGIDTKKVIKKIVPVKIKYADRVTMTEIEYNKLIDKYSTSIIDNKITDLDLWKGSKGKSTKSDYFTILTWLRKDKPITTHSKVEKQF